MSTADNKITSHNIEEAYLDCLLGGDLEVDLSVTPDIADVVELHPVETGDTEPQEINEEPVQAEQVHHDQTESVQENVDQEMPKEEVETEDHSMPCEDADVIFESYQQLAGKNGPIVCQLIRVAGLKLAIPLSSFNRIVDLPETTKVNPNQSSPCFGKFSRDDKSNFVIAIARLIFGGKAETENSKQVLLLGDKGFALLCDEILETTSIQTDEVNWRTVDSERKWLAGTVKTLGCSVLDIPGILSAATQR